MFFVIDESAVVRSHLESQLITDNKP